MRDRPGRIWPNGIWLDIGVAVAFCVTALCAVAACHAAGLLQIPNVYSDEAEHYRRSLAAAAIFQGDFTEANIASLYSQGIWPPAYPLVIGLFQVLFDLSLYELRVLNILFVIGGVFLFGLALPPSRRLWVLPVAVLTLLFDFVAPQLRPENLAILVLGAIAFLVTRFKLLGRGSGEEQRGPWLYAGLGVLAALLPLVHASFAFAGLYLVALSIFALPRRFPVPVVFALMAGSYFLLQNVFLHAQFVFFAVTSEEGLARNNNPYWDSTRSYAENWGAAFDKVDEEVERRYAAGDIVHYPRPALVPEARYAEWLHLENRRRMFGEISRGAIAADPQGFVARIPQRFVWAALRDPCAADDITPAYRNTSVYNCRLAPDWMHTTSWFLALALACAGLLALLVAEWRRAPFEFTFLCLSAALLVPMVVISAQTRQLPIVMLVLIFGGLARYKAPNAVALHHARAAPQAERAGAR